MELGNETWAAIVGAAVGTLGSGFVGYWLQRKNLIEARKQRLESEQNKKKSLGFSILFKMIRILSNLVQLGNHIAESKTVARKENAENDPWQFFLPLATLPENVTFTTEEMAFLLSLKEDEFFNEIASFDDVHNKTIEMFRGIDVRREWLKEQLPARMEGAIAHIELDREQVLRLRPKMVELNMLIGEVDAWCQREVPTSERLLFRLNQVLRDKVGIETSLEMKEKGAERHGAEKKKAGLPGS